MNAVFVCSRVSGGGPVLTVVHDHDESWQMICDGDHDEAGLALSGESCHVEHFAHPLEHDATLEAVRDLACGWKLHRDNIGDPFRREPVEQDSDAAGSAAET